MSGRILILILILIGRPTHAQNWAVRTYATVTNTDPYIVQGGPTNWSAEWRNIGTNLTATAPFSFVGNDAARGAWISARIGAFNTWKSATFDPADNLSRTLVTSNKTWLIQQRDLERSNLWWLQTNRQVQTLLTLSNQVQSLTRLQLLNDRILSE